jgi:antagonist of KipI
VFDAAARPPALILPGDRVRFVPVRELPAPPGPDVTTPQTRTSRPSLEVLDGGLLTTVQDHGRIGHRRLGIAACGPMDADAHAAANRLAGNPPDAAALECTWVGPTLRFLATTVFVVTGADLRAVLHRSDLGDWPVPLGSRLLARAGNVLSLAKRREGCRAYVAFAGGIEIPPILGSRATDITGGLGGFDGRALQAGDVLGLGPPPTRDSEPVPPTAAPSGTPSSSVIVRVVPGPHEDCLTPESLDLLLAGPYAVSQASNRTGYRLEGPRLRHRGPAEVISDGMTFGSIQVPPDGQPIVMMADGPTTGGYPQVSTVVTADLPLLAQLAPGEGHVRFQAVTIEEAQRSARTDLLDA